MKKIKWECVAGAVSVLLLCVAIFMGVQYLKEREQYRVSEEEYQALIVQ